MGESGAITIINNEEQIFHFNYDNGDLKQDDIYEICPPLKDKENDTVKYDEEWKEFILFKLYYIDDLS